MTRRAVLLPPLLRPLPRSVGSMAMQTGPRSPLEDAEPQLLFELLVRLLADPACLDGCGQAQQRGAQRAGLTAAAWVSVDAKMHISFWDYLGSRLAVQGCQPIPPIAGLVSIRCRSP